MSMKTVVLAAAMAALSGCATSKMASVVSPGGVRPFDSVIVYAENMDLPTRIAFEAEACARLAPTRCIQSLQVIEFSTQDQEAYNRLRDVQADGLLVVGLLSDHSSTSYVGTVNTGSSTTNASATANVYGNTALASGSSTTTSSGTSIPIYAFSRSTSALVMLFDKRTGKTAWEGQLDTQSGAASYGDEAMARAAAGRLAKEMRAKLLVRQ